MAESMQGLKRTHRCGELSSANIGEKVTVMGWVQKNRNKGGIVFMDLRDRSGILQIVFEGEEQAELMEKAAKLGYALVKNHAFIDGNKRIGVYVMLIFLDVNGIKMIYSDNDIIALGLGIADDSLDYKDVLTWVNRHKDATK